MSLARDLGASRDPNGELARRLVHSYCAVLIKLFLGDVFVAVGFVVVDRQLSSCFEIY